MRDNLRVGPVLAEQGFGDDDILPELQLAGDLLGDRLVIARHHLDVDAHGAGRRNGLGAIVPRRIEQRQQAEKPPFARFIGARDAQGAVALCGVLVDQLGDRLALFGVRLRKDRRSLAARP